ncbi:uncharacterized protein [Dermacentor albipictus]|uniref:uncharacterized protein n=1 Tax=Dermacentor albipictus TaxID=60249 RepID=UPI0038FC895A
MSNNSQRTMVHSRYTSVQKAADCSVSQVARSSRMFSTGHKCDSHRITANVAKVFTCSSEQIFKALDRGPVMPTAVESGICPALVNEPWFTAATPAYKRQQTAVSLRLHVAPECFQQATNVTATGLRPTSPKYSHAAVNKSSKHSIVDR